MSTEPKPRREHPSAYFVQDRSNPEEITRLQIQDALINVGIGGVLPEQSDLNIFQRVLDIGCGTGGWLIKLAKTVPTCTRLVGVDVSLTLVEYARAQAEAAHVSDRVEFYVMDALRMIEFPSHFFDLVNLRFGMSWLRIWEWPKLLQEMQRVTRRDGVVRFTEAIGLECTSLALTRLSTLAFDAFSQAGHLPFPHGDHQSSGLVSLLTRYGVEQVQTSRFSLTYHANMPEWPQFCESTRLCFHVITPFLRKWTRLPEDYSELSHQAIREMHESDFIAIVKLFTAWGKASFTD